MRNWLEQLLKIACLVLAALLIYRLALTAVHLNPLAHVRVPDLPVLTPETNALTTVKGTNAPVPGQLAKSGTNASVRGAERTNTAARVAGTNTVPAATNATVSRNSGTNGAPLTNQLSSVAPNPALHTAIPSVGTNSLASALTNTSSNAIIRLTGGISGSNATAISNLTKVNPTQAVAMARGSRPDVVILSAGGSSRVRCLARPNYRRTRRRGCFEFTTARFSGQ